MISSKAEIRKEMLRLRKIADKAGIKKIGAAITEKVLQLDEYKKAETVYLYYPVRNEADISRLIQVSLETGKKVLMPKVLNDTDMEFYQIKSLNDLQEGYMGIFEPREELEPYALHNEKSFMVVPGVAFDKAGGRIGMGKGYYDRYINSHDISVTCGVCAGFQLLNDEKIPADEHDRYMDYIVTEEILIKRNS